MSGGRPMGMAEKRKASDPCGDGAWKIMRKMGYEQGRGLGINAQGVIEPVALSKQKGRSGLGLGSKCKQVEPFSGVLYQSTDPNLVWHEGCDEASADGDLIWTWSIKKEVCTVSRLNSLIIPPDEAKALGPPIEEMESQNKFCSPTLVHEVITYKNQLDHLSKAIVTESHERCNPYEMIKKGIFMNRAAMKMANIDSIFGGMFTTAAHRKDILYFADVCAGPGGFSEYTLWRRCNSPYPVRSSQKSSVKDPVTTDHPNDNVDDDDNDDDSPSEDNDNSESNQFGDHESCKQRKQSLFTAKGFGLTLTGSCDFRENDFLAGPREAFMAHYGPTHDGDITKWVNLASFSSFIGRSTNGVGVHILMADGGFDVSGQHNLQEVLSKQIYLCQCLCALINLRPGGHFLTKLFDTLTEFTAGLIYLMGHLFEEIFIVKPVTSRPANSERYLVCKNLQSSLSTMAGCLLPPKSCEINNFDSTNDNTIDQKSSFRQKPRKFPGQQQYQTLSMNSTGNYDEQDLEKKYGILNDKHKSDPLGLVINHFLQVNEKLNKLILLNNSISTSSKMDVLKLCQSEIIQSDQKFMQFMQNMNEGIAEHQCIALSKLIAFSQNHNLIEDRQVELHKACLEKWKVPLVERRLTPWPLLSANRSVIIHGLLGDKEKFISLNMLPSEYRPNIRLTSFNNTHFSNLDALIGSRIALVCGNPSLTSTSEPAQSMFIYSRGSGVMDIFCTTDGDRWNRLDQVIPRLKPRLPPGTLVWGQPVYEYVVKNGLRKHALFIYDVVCIYGRDCRKLAYRKRMQLAEQMANIVNYPDMTASNVRVPPFIKLSELGDYIKKLPLLPCKDSPTLVPMHCLPNGFTFQPHSLLLVQHMAENWVEAISRSTGKVYYFNRSTSESTFSLPKSEQLTFTDTYYIKLLWKSEQKYCPTVMTLVQYLEQMTNICQ